MDKKVLENKLESLRKCLARIANKTPRDVVSLQRDVDVQDILVLNLERSVQVCVDIATHLLADTDVPAPTTMIDTFDVLAHMKMITMATAIRMQKAVGFRNLAVHEYDKLNWNIVYKIVTKHLDDFRRFSQQVYRYVQRKKPTRQRRLKR